MKAQEIFDRLWDIYITDNPSVLRVHDAFVNAGETVLNDHIAFRTFDHPKINIEVLSRPFLKAGYVEKEQYNFEVKKLFAKHYEHPDPSLPLVFISELKTSEFSDSLKNLVGTLADAIRENLLQSDELIYSGNCWGQPSYEVYRDLLKESEYAAWVYFSGYRANHFTVRVNHLKNLDSIEKVNTFLKEQGFSINNSGGEVKGNPELFLEQSSIVAEGIEVSFREGKYMVPGCFYEFARRYPLPDGNLFMGFVADSADKIFESTNAKA
jgi:hypothetical protein